MSTIISSKIRHRVSFAPDPANPAFGTAPVYVPQRAIKDISTYPKDVKYVFFDDVVVTQVELPSGERKTLVSEPFNKDTFFVKYSCAVAESIALTWHTEPVGVHPAVAGKVYVIPTTPQGADEQAA